MKMNFTVPIAALVVGAALGYCCVPRGEAKVTPEPEKGESKVVKVGLSDKGSVDALRARIKELERQLAEKDAATEQKVPENGAGPAPEGQRWPNGEEIRANFEKWKKDNPEEYARMDKMRQDFLARRTERANSKLDFLASVDTSRMSKEDLATHTRLQELIAKRNNLEKGLNESLLNMSEEERGNFFREMGETSREIRELNQKERGVLFNSLAGELGLQGEEANAVSDAVQGILDATSNREGFGGFGGPGGGFGGPGGPGGGFGGGRGPGGGFGGGRGPGGGR